MKVFLGGSIDSVKVDPCNSQRIVVAGSCLTGQLWTGDIYLLKAASGAVVARCSLGAGVSDVDFVSSGGDASQAVLVSGSDDASVDVWKVGDGRDGSAEQGLQRVASGNGHDDVISCVSAQPGGANASSGLFLSASWDSNVFLWDLASGMGQAKTKFQGHMSRVLSAQWSPLSTTLFASTCQDGRVHVWDTRSAEKSAQSVIVGRRAVPLCVAWSKVSENVLAYGLDSGDIHLADQRQLSTPVATYAGYRDSHGGCVRRVLFGGAEFGAGGALFSVGDDARLVRILAPESEAGGDLGKRRLVASPHDGLGHVHGLACDPGSKTVFTASRDGSVAATVMPADV
eukprot:jgi/Mesvir1/28953/Mv17731-RA.1